MKFASGAAVNAIIPPDPLNPLGLPPFTMRGKFNSGYTPNMGDSQTLVDAEENVWDIYKNSTDWHNLFSWNGNLLDVLGANTTGIMDMHNLFTQCWNLNSIALFDTSLVTDMSSMFNSCSKLLILPFFNTSSCVNMGYMCRSCSLLTNIPLFDTSLVIDISAAFYNCNKVEQGALALYQQASSQTNVPTHTNTFYDCGSGNIAGMAELRQIPSDWGGMAS